MQKKDTKQPDKSKVVSAILVITLILVANILDQAEKGAPEMIVVAVMVMIIGISVGLFVAVAKKKVGGAVVDKEAVRRRMSKMGFAVKESPEHSHDRLQSNNTAQVCDEDEYTHWKKQLDDFLEAGVIEKSEYNTLLSRYKSEK